MSGPGGGGGGGWDREPPDDCSKLSEVTTLNSPDKDVLKEIRKNDQLQIRLRPQSRAVVVEALYKGNVAGTITSSIINKLAECIEGGHHYVADVLEEVRGGVCKVRVHAK